MALKLIEKEHLLDNIWAFRFAPSEPLTWVAGQYVSVELPHEQPDGKGTKRWFTISSAPYEKMVQITTRVTDSSFKQALARLEVGDDLQLMDEPHGKFVWQEGEPLVFVAGGIGITPFRSMLKQRAHDGLPLDATLVYGSRTAEVPFGDELRTWAAMDAGLKVHYVVNAPLTAAGLAEMAPELREALVYLSGPRPVMMALGDELVAEGLPEARIRQEFFPSYTKANY